MPDWTGLHGTFGVPTVDESTAYLQRRMWYLKMKFHEDERDGSVPLTASPFHRSKSSLTAETTLREKVYFAPFTFLLPISNWLWSYGSSIIRDIYAITILIRHGRNSSPQNIVWMGIWRTLHPRQILHALDAITVHDGVSICEPRT